MDGSVLPTNCEFGYLPRPRAAGAAYAHTFASSKQPGAARHACTHAEKANKMLPSRLVLPVPHLAVYQRPLPSVISQHHMASLLWLSRMTISPWQQQQQQRSENNRCTRRICVLIVLLCVCTRQRQDSSNAAALATQHLKFGAARAAPQHLQDKIMLPHDPTCCAMAKITASSTCSSPLPCRRHCHIHKHKHI